MKTKMFTPKGNNTTPPREINFFIPQLVKCTTDDCVFLIKPGSQGSTHVIGVCLINDAKQSYCTGMEYALLKRDIILVNSPVQINFEY